MKPDRKETEVYWKEVRQRAVEVNKKIQKRFSHKEIKVWGVPSRGVYAALILQAVSKKIVIVDYLEDADCVIDDIIDTGETSVEFTTPYFALFDLREGKPDAELGWPILPWEREQRVKVEPEENIRQLIRFIGDDIEREGLRNTPKMVVQSYRRIYGGYTQSAEDVLQKHTIKKEPQMVIVKDVEFHSTCEHTMLPFSGKIHISYISEMKVVEVSKLVELMEVFTRRLQNQENIGEQITDALMSILDAQGACCIIEAQHHSLAARGMEKEKAKSITSSVKGIYNTSLEVYKEFLALIK